MPVAYVLVDADVGRIKGIIEELRKTAGVAEAYSVAGPHDIIVKVQSSKFEDVAQTVTQRIHKIPGVKNTLTLFAFE